MACCSCGPGCSPCGGYRSHNDSFPNAYQRVASPPCCPTKCCCRCCCPAPTAPPCPPRAGASLLGCGCCRPKTCHSKCCPTPDCCYTPGPGCARLRCTRPRNSGFCTPNFRTCPTWPSGSCCSTCQTCGY